MNLFKKLFDFWQGPAIQTKVQLVASTGSDLTIKSWGEHLELVSEAHSLSQTPIFKAMMECLKNESPANYKMPKGAQPTDLVVHLGEIDGYNMALNNLLALTIPPAESAPLTATFEPDNIEEIK